MDARVVRKPSKRKEVTIVSNIPNVPPIDITHCVSIQTSLLISSPQHLQPPEILTAWSSLYPLAFLAAGVFVGQEPQIQPHQFRSVALILSPRNKLGDLWGLHLKYC